MEDIDKTIYMDSFKKEITVTFPEIMENNIASVIDELNVLLQENINELCRRSITDAVEFVENTGEAFFLFWDPEEYEEEINGLMKKWNNGDTEELVSCIDRWYSKDDAEKIAQECKNSSNGKHISVYELHKSVAEAIIKLGLSEDNFGNVYPAIKDSLVKEPKEILLFMRPNNIVVYLKHNDTLQFVIDFNCDWEIEHGIAWSITDTKTIFVGRFDDII